MKHALIVMMVIASTGLVGCATSRETYTADGEITTTTPLPPFRISREVYTADGEIGHSINCSGKFMTWGGCFAEAGQLCGSQGYTVLAQNGEKGGFITGGSQVSEAGGSFGGSSSIYGSTTHIRSMLIKCGKPNDDQ